MRATAPSPPAEPGPDWPAPAGTRLYRPRAARADLAAVRAHVAAGARAAGLDAAGRDALVLAADEVCANVVLHAYADAPGPLTVDVAAAPDGGCTCTIVDAGPPFDPAGVRPAPADDTPLAARPVGGLGWHLVRQSVDALRYARVGAHNVVVLERRAAGAAPSTRR